jgi:ribosomal-protein-alanine N-acetyltransferase
MRRVFLPAVREIDRLSFDRPWSGEEFEGFLRNGNGNHLGLVVTAGGRVRGYALFRRRRRSLLLIRAAVHPDARRRGLGRELLACTARYCLGSARAGVVVEADEGDLGAQLWLRACHFPCVRVLDGVYRFVYRV